jgi:hypothetical protein
MAATPTTEKYGRARLPPSRGLLSKAPGGQPGGISETLGDRPPRFRQVLLPGWEHLSLLV